MKEFGEGVDRIYRDMAEAGLPEPEYKQSEAEILKEMMYRPLSGFPNPG